MSIRVSLVEDNPALRKRLEEYLLLFPELELASSYASGEAALNGLKKMAPSELPKVVLMDIELPNISGIETTEKLKASLPEIDVIMLTVFEDQSSILEAIQAGASGYLLKDEPPDAILEAIKECLGGGAPISQSIARKVLGMLRAPSGKPSPRADHKDLDLSEREIELLRGLVNGETYVSLAEKLFISPHTVRTHIRNIYTKLHVHSRAQAVKLALEKGVR